jgi:diketogulonate reductase-like aldo/keto reductase
VEYRELGHTGDKVSTIGMGTWRIGVFGSAKEKEAQISALRKGVELGMNLIDTAEVYAGGKSEELVAEAARGIRDKLFIASKVSPDNLHHDDVIAACEGSLRRLGTSYIDLYQVHWPNPRIPIRETMSAMETLAATGKIRHVGLSNFSVAQTEEARESTKKIDIAANQVEYSFSNRTAEEQILPYCAREKLTLIAYSPLSRGKISSMPGSIAKRYGMSAPQLMLNWVTRAKEVVAIPKASTMEHVVENAASIEVRLSPEDYEELSRG